MIDDTVVNIFLVGISLWAVLSVAHTAWLFYVEIPQIVRFFDDASLAAYNYTTLVAQQQIPSDPLLGDSVECKDFLHPLSYLTEHPRKSPYRDKAKYDKLVEVLSAYSNR